jgi:hypothetical protein
VVSAEAELATPNYNVLSGEAVVFVVDVTRDFAEYHFREQHIPLLQKNDIISIAASSGYWHVEDNRQSRP